MKSICFPPSAFCFLPFANCLLHLGNGGAGQEPVPLEPLPQHPLWFTMHLISVSTIEKGPGKRAARLDGVNL